MSPSLNYQLCYAILTTFIFKDANVTTYLAKILINEKANDLDIMNVDFIPSFILDRNLGPSIHDSYILIDISFGSRVRSGTKNRVNPIWNFISSAYLNFLWFYENWKKLFAH